MTITAEERRARIVELVRELGTVRVVDLAERLGMAAVTVRRDVATLAEEGVLHRSHGAVSMPADETTAQGVPGRDRVIGMLVPTVGTYFDEVIAGARAAATAVGARLVLGISPYEADNDRAQVEQLLASGVDGLLVTPNWTPEGPAGQGGWLCELPVPTVLVERRPPVDSICAGLDSVSSDHRHGVMLALRHLIALGHRSVLLAARMDSWTALQVRAGYRDAVRLLGLEHRQVIDIEVPGRDSELVAAQVDVQLAAGATAVLVHNDQEALQLLPLLRARGLQVPEDVALISYDDVFAALAAPPLTAVAPPKHAVGAGAVELLLRRLSSGAELPVHHLELLPELKVRTSCGGLG
jgi:DNA-binding LacI/PurR family transcriptional regulator